MKKYLKFILLLILIIAGFACYKFGYIYIKEREINIALSANLPTMPNLINTDLNKAGIRLSELGFKVKVVREARDEKLKNGKVAKILHIEHDFLPLKWNHMIARQSPDAGLPLKNGDTITLYAGMHHGFGHFDAWVKMHPKSIAMRGGDERCMQCHTRQTCASCHDSIGVKSR